jgi:hypothetical protein
MFSYWSTNLLFAKLVTALATQTPRLPRQVREKLALNCRTTWGERRLDFFKFAHLRD